MNMLRTAEADLAVVDSDGAKTLHGEGLKLFVNRNVAHALMTFYKCYDPDMVTHDVRFRKAAILAIDRQAIVKALFSTRCSDHRLPGGTLSRRTAYRAGSGGL